MTNKTTRLKELLTSKSLTILMEAHNGLSATIVEETGFPAIWGSGLSVSASLGVRDSNEASWTQVLEVLEFMADATSIPILLDGDTGYGNFNNARRLVQKLEQRRVAGVCLEDKLFPKTNSFIDGERQELAAVDEFCGKIRAAKDTQKDPDFVVVARTEAFIAGWGLEEALLRASAYAESGADAILCHSKRNDAEDIAAFMRQWPNDVPVIIVPTTYPKVPMSDLVAMGVTNVIFANQAVRSSIRAMQQNLRTLFETQDLTSIEEQIVPVKEIFRLQDVSELKTSEKRYLPQTSSPVRALILAASKGDMGAHVNDKPKAMIPIRGKSILDWQAEAYRRQGIKQIAVVRGYAKESVVVSGATFVDNERYAETGEVASIIAGIEHLSDDVLISYGDILFDQVILTNLLATKAEIVLAADAAWRFRRKDSARRDLVITEGVAVAMASSECLLKEVSGQADDTRASGEMIGLLLIRQSRIERLKELLQQLRADAPHEVDTWRLPDLLNRLVTLGESVHVVHSFGHWYDINTEADLQAANERRVERRQPA